MYCILVITLYKLENLSKEVIFFLYKYGKFFSKRIPVSFGN